MTDATEKIKRDLAAVSSERDAVFLQRFFKTGKGQYGEGDVFIGVRAPQNRAVAKKHFKEISLADTEKLLQSPVHEHRVCALSILRLKFENSGVKEQEKIVKIYLKNTRRINNWDLVDLSACYILGPWFYGKNLDVINKLAASNFLWEERISVLTSYYFIRQKDYALTLKLCKKFLTHKHDLMHKATGWMLREAGKRDLKPLLKFLDENAAKMPRTMLRYSVEKLPPPLRKKYMDAK